jgi:filamentous hemagglutinin family protein
MTRIASSRAAPLGGNILAAGKAPAHSRVGAIRSILLVGAAMLGTAAPAIAQTATALPNGGVFTAGTGTIQSSSSTMTVTQSSNRGVIDWNDFSIAVEHQVNIQNGGGATLNRVTGGALSRLDGMLTATGSVYLMNPNGVVVGAGGKVLTGGDFVASTRAIDSTAFMGGGPLAISGGSPSAITNAGSIVSKAGSVVMIARTVTNTGSIEASRGRVTLAAADQVLMATTDGKSDGLYVSVSGGGGDVTQAGRIQAAAVALKAANGNIFALAGNRDGLVQATGTATIDGELWLTAPNGAVEAGGTLKAANADGSGGRVIVNGRDVALGATADISAAGTSGGEVLIGAAAYASGTGLAESTRIADGARISAGGPAGGGRIETSGKALALGNATITAGSGGKWLIDPDDLLIDAGAAATIVSSLNGGTDVTEQTFAAGTGGVGDITVAAPIVWTGSGNLTFFAYRDLLVNATISGGGDVTMNAGRNLSLAANVSSQTLVHAVVVSTLTIGAAGSASATGNVVLETGNFINQSGAGALSSTGGVWAILSDDAAGSDDGGLLPAYYLYDYANAPGFPAPGNGRFYRAAPSISFTLGPVIKDYDGTTNAVLDSGNVNVTGLVNGDDFTLDGSYATKNAGTGINVTAANFAAERGGIPVFGYNVTTPSVAAAVGTINRAALIAAIIGTPTKTYNATTAVSLTAANFQLTGVAIGEAITVGGAASSAYDSANAGNRTVNATFQTSNFAAGSGTSLTNYILPTSASGAGLINPASILISGITADDKVYDGTTAAVLDTGAASIFGVVGSDDVTLDLSGATGVFATKNVGTAIAVTGTGFVLSGADAANYVIGQPTDLAANVTPASLVVSGLVANDKIYDGTVTDSLNAAGVQFTGMIAGDDVTADGMGAQVNFATKNAGQDIPVSITGMTLSGADAGNYSLSYSDSLVADIFQRVLTFGFSGSPTKVYDGTTNAVVSAADATLGNVVASESVTIAQAADIQYASKNVGTWNITGSLTPADFLAGPGTLLSNYVLPTSVATQGEITPAPLTISITGNPTKAYDGNADASLGPSNFAVSGFVFGEGATITQTSGEYGSADAGTRTVTADLDASDFDPDSGTMMSNYFIPSPVSGTGTITRIPLGPGVIVVDITGNPSKVYDGTTVATLTSSDYTLGGFIAGEGATITETVGSYDLKDAGLRAVLVLLDPGDFLPDPGTNLDNYTLPTEATGIGTIFARQLTAAIIGNPTKVYNGTVRAAVVPGNYAIVGAIAGESVTVAPGVVANYGDADAGARLITASFTADSNFVFGSGTLRSNYILPALAQGPGTITPAPLVVLGVSAQNKVYDQTLVAALAGSASLFGIVAGDTVTLQGGSAAGAFATPNVGNGVAVTVTGYGISGADAGNYQLFQPTGLTANITPRGLVIANVSALDKLYDGTTVATLDLGGAGLTGQLPGDDVTLDTSGSTAAFLQKNIGIDLRVLASGFTLSGAQAGNYALSQPSGLTADINPRALTGAIIGNPTRTYDGTTSVSLTAANYSLAGFVAGEGGAIGQSAGATYDSANAGARTVTATLVVSDFTAQAGTLLSNYVLPTSISGAGTITQAQLIAAIIGNPTRVYDGTTAATLTSANYELAGFVAGEGATVTETAGLYDTKNVGGRIVTATLGTGDFTGTGSTNLANYALPTSAVGAGMITPAQVQVIGILANDKTYDGTTAAVLTSGGGGLTGVFGGDTVSLVSTGASGTFATKNVGTDITVTAAGYTIAGGDAGNYTVLQPTGLTADIFQAVIQLASVTRVYDSTTTVPTADNAYTLANVVAGDSVGVDASGITGNYADKNVGTGKNVTLTGVVLNGTDAGNYLIDPGVTNAAIGIINPATLNVLGVVALDKTYDQNTIAQLDNGATALSGVFAGDVVALSNATTGNFNNANAGTAKPVTTTAYSISGTDAGNYTLVQPQGLTANIDPRGIFLTSVVKTYDGTTALPAAAAAYGFTGVLGGDTVTADTSGVSGAYAQKDVGGSISGGVVTGGIGITISGLALGGASGSNYFVNTLPPGAQIGVINPATLAVAIIGNPTKTYDSNGTASLVTGNYQLTGFVSGEGATITQTVGTYDTVNQGARTVATGLSTGNYTADPGTLLSNYVLPPSALGPGTIDPRLLTITGALADDKVYDGNTAATLSSGGATLVNVVSGDTVALNSAGATGVFASPDVGTNIAVTASGYALTNNALGNYVLEQPTGLTANITAALLTLTRVARVYTAGTLLPTDASAYTLTGVVAGDAVTVDAAAAAASGSYADKNVATGILVTIGNLAIIGADASNYSIANAVTAQPIGEITPATLFAIIIGTPTRTYDGTIAALLGQVNYQISGFVGGEGATINQMAGSYDSPNAGSRTVTASLLAGNFDTDPGTSLANYILPTSASGAGLIDPKALAVTIIGNPNRTYDGTIAALLGQANYDLTGFVSGESAVVTQTAGTYASANAGSRTVTATLGGGDFTAGSGTLLANYVLPTSASGGGTIDRATLTAAIIGTPTKVYDGNRAITLGTGNYQLSGFIAGEGATVTETAGLFGSPNAGPGTILAALDTGDFTANSGTLLANYNLPELASGAGLISQAVLTALIAGNPTKTYDGTALATLGAANYTLIGFVTGEGATVTQTVGSYGSPNAGLRTVTASLATGDFTADSGTVLANYVLPITASGAGTIDQATLVAAIIGNPTRTYDGTVLATLTSANFTLSGFVGSEGATVTQTTGAYDTANAGSRTVTASLASGDFTPDGGTLLANYILPTGASGAGLINQAMLTAAIIGIPTKTYDATTAATLSSANFRLNGFVAGEGATVTQTSGTYAAADAGLRTITTTLASTDFVASGGTLLANYILPAGASGVGLIGRATLTAAIIGNPSKTYDATTLATLTSANYALTGFVGSDGATVTETSGTYSSADAGLRTVTATLGSADFVADGGTRLTNYILPANASGLGTIGQATLIAAITGNPTKTYDGTTATPLAVGDYSLTGFIASEGATVTQTSGSYDSANAGSRTVLALLGGGDFTANSGTTLANYALPTSATGAGTIDQATLTVAIIGTPTRAYDGTTVAALTSANFALAGFVAGESATVTQTSGSYGSANAGPRIVTATLAAGDFTADSGTLLANYILPTDASGAGLISQAALFAIIIGNPTKTYDGSTAAALASANYQLSGFIAGEGATLTQAAGNYGSADAGTRIVTANLARSDFAADSGTLLTNYALPTSAIGAGTINQATLAAIIVGNPTKTYDGTTAATLTPANFALAGFIAGEGATVTQASGSYAAADIGTRLVATTLGGSDFVANSGTNLANYVLPTGATGLGTIDPALLTAAIIGVPTKTYDATTLAALTSTNYQLSGFAAGEGATVGQTVGSYDSPNAGARLVTAMLAAGDFTATGSTRLSNYVLPTSASGAGLIDRATLTAILVGNPTRTYDGTTGATLAASNYLLAGFIAGEGATVSETVGAYAAPDAGIRLITATLGIDDFIANSGTLLGNYALPTSAAGLGTIDRAVLAAAIIGNPTRTYDGSVAAPLTSANYQLAGFVAGEGAIVGQAAGTYDSANAGARIVTALLGTGDFTATGTTVLANYILPASASGAGTIDRAMLAAAIVGTPTRVYDGTTAARLKAANFALSGFVAGEGASVTQTAGIYSSANAGDRSVTASLSAGNYAANVGTLLSNYVLPTSAAGAGLINRAELTVAITGDPTKTYDGNSNATLVAADYTIAGFVTGEGAAITETQGSYADPSVGMHDVSVTLDAGDYAANSGTLLSNYNLPTTATGPGEITANPPPRPCAVPYAADCQIKGLPILLGTRRFYIPYPSVSSVYFAHTNGFAALPGILRQSSVTPIPGGLLIRTGVPTINAAEQILMQGDAAKEFILMFPPAPAAGAVGALP